MKKNLILIQFLLISVTVLSQDIQTNLRTQLNEYLVAFTQGDTERAVNYIYPDLFVWMEKKAKNEGYKYGLEDMKKDFAESLAEMNRIISQTPKKVKFFWSLEDLEKIAEVNNYIIYICKTSLIGKIENEEIKLGDVTVCISSDRGITWRFLNRDDENCPEILRIRFADSIVQKVMAK